LKTKGSVQPPRLRIMNDQAALASWFLHQAAVTLAIGRAYVAGEVRAVNSAMPLH
jgi:hypothetical protein